jgi:threonine/homoserine/homoserine lactone efflux protein
VLQYLLLGGGYAFAAAIQPGPLQAFLVSRVTATGWRRTLPASLAPLISDGPIALVAILALSRLPPWFQHALRAAGGILLVSLAWTAFRQWRDPSDPTSDRSAPRTALEAALVNLLNPNPYLGWALVLGPSFVAAWNEHPGYGLALVVAFYGTMVVSLSAFILMVGTTRFLGPRRQRALVALSAALLAGLGIYLLLSSLWSLGST